jgi:hypothetical protein
MAGIDRDAAFAALLDGMDDEMTDDAREQLRSRIAADLRRRIEIVECDGDRLSIKMKPAGTVQYEFVFVRSRFVEFRWHWSRAGTTHSETAEEFFASPVMHWYDQVVAA